MKWNQIFNRGKRVAQAEATGSLHSLLLPSVLGIAVCMLTLCSLTWAWFTASVSSGVTAIQSANIAVYMYGVTAVEPSTNEGTAETFAAGNETTLLEVGKKYTVNLSDGTIRFTMNGNAKMAYLEIQVGDDTQYTNYLAKGNDDTEGTIYAITLDTNGAAVFVTLKWGPHPAGLEENYNFLSVSTTVDVNQDKNDEGQDNGLSGNGTGESGSNGETGGTDDSSETNGTGNVDGSNNNDGTGNAGNNDENSGAVSDGSKSDNNENGGDSPTNNTENTNTPTDQPTTESSNTPEGSAA